MEEQSTMETSEEDSKELSIDVVYEEIEIVTQKIEENVKVVKVIVEQSFPCPHCPRLFNRRNMVTRHVNEIHKIALPFACDLCDRTFSVIPSLQKHLMNVHNVDPEPYSCPHCPSTFTLQILQTQHDCLRKKPKPKTKPKTKPKQKPQKPHQCPHCSKQFHTKSTLTRHINSHFRCPHCRKSLPSAEKLTKHLKTHENANGTFPCELCDKKFVLEENRGAHLRVWHGEEVQKPWGCGSCEVRFRGEGALVRHNERAHFCCGGCGVVFGKRGGLGRHVCVKDVNEVVKDEIVNEIVKDEIVNGDEDCGKE